MQFLLFENAIKKQKVLIITRKETIKKTKTLVQN